MLALHLHLLLHRNLSVALAETLGHDEELGSARVDAFVLLAGQVLAVEGLDAVLEARLGDLVVHLEEALNLHFLNGLKELTMKVLRKSCCCLHFSWKLLVYLPVHPTIELVHVVSKRSHRKIVAKPGRLERLASILLLHSASFTRKVSLRLRRPSLFLNTPFCTEISIADICKRTKAQGRTSTKVPGSCFRT